MAKDPGTLQLKKAGRSWWKRAFIAGLAALLPTILTIALLVFAWGMLNKYITTPINDGVKWVLHSQPAREFITYPLWDLKPTGPPPGPPGEDRAALWVLRVDPTGREVAEPYTAFLDRRYPSGLGPKSTALSAIGLVLGVALIFTAGIFFTSFLGRRARRWLEQEFYKIPIIKAIYPYAKQITDFIFKEDKSKTFSAVVALEYPRKGVYSIGFVTGAGFKTISATSGKKMINVFIPSSPTPVTGYVIFVPEADVTPLPITVDQAIRFSVSGGVLIPEEEAMQEAAVEFRSGRIAGVSGSPPQD